MQAPLPTVLILSADAALRATLAALVVRHGWRAEGFATAAELLSHPRPQGATCLLFDLDLPGFRGVDLQRLLGVARDVPVVFHSGTPAPGSLTDSIRQALRRSEAALADAQKLLELRAAWLSLTPREREIMALVVTGLLNKQVGGELGISEVTVKQHRGQLMRKMNADSLADLVRMADRLNIPSTPRLARRPFRGVNITRGSVSVRGHEAFRPGTQAQGGASR
jgi:FixJ family two-component response regulator